jgi:hypothetical protein
MDVTKTMVIDGRFPSVKQIMHSWPLLPLHVESSGQWSACRHVQLCALAILASADL